MKSLQGFWKSLKSLLKLREPKENVRIEVDSLKEEKRKIEVPPEPKGPISDPIIRRQLKKIYLQVGLDFGTHSTKIVYSQIGKQLSRAVNFKHNLPNYPKYCLPSVAAFDDHGKLLLGVEAAKLLQDKEWDSGLQRLKVIVAGNHDKAFKDPISHEKFYEHLKRHGCNETLTPERLTAIYLAYAMKKARELIEERTEYKDVELDVTFNVCVPIDHLENNKVKSVFQNILTWAEAIERKWDEKGDEFEPINASYDLESKSHSEDRRVFLVPEAVAEMASYLVSLRKREGLHAIIDLGAGTTDVSICNLFIPSSGSISYWYATRNIPAGTIKVGSIIASYLKEQANKRPCSCVEVSNFLDNLGSYHSSTTGTQEGNWKLMSSIKDEIRAIRDSEDYRKTWGSAYMRHLKKQSAWEKVEVFVSGGGANLPFIEEVFSIPWWSQLEKKYPVSSLPAPDDFSAEDSGAPFQRMAVAYGLARPIPELDDYVLPGYAPDHTPPPLPTRNGPDRDDLYPK